MKYEVDCIILWHKFYADGQLMGATSTHLVGSMQNLNDRLREADEQCKKNQDAGTNIYTIAAQIISSNVPRECP